MTIIEQIVAGLQTKFPDVDKAILTRIATKKGENVTDEDKVNSIVEGIGFKDVLQSYSDYRANEASLTAVANYEKKYGIKDGKPVVKEDHEPEPKDNKDNMATIIANAVNAAVKPLSDELSAIKAERNQASRQAQIMEKAKEYGIPEQLVPTIKMADDADIDTSLKDYKQTLVNVGFKDVSAPETGQQKIERENESIAKQIEEGTKEILKQNKE